MVSLPIVENIAPRVISIPFDSDATESTVRRMANTLVEAINENPAPRTANIYGQQYQVGEKFRDRRKISSTLD